MDDPSIARNCIWMDVFDQVFTVWLLAAGRRMSASLAVSAVVKVRWTSCLSASLSPPCASAVIPFLTVLAVRSMPSPRRVCSLVCGCRLPAARGEDYRVNTPLGAV